jgi:hypothetical protein
VAGGGSAGALQPSAAQQATPLTMPAASGWADMYAASSQ